MALSRIKCARRMIVRVQGVINRDRPAALTLLVLALLVANFGDSLAYEFDTHYWLKMKLAINCGFSLDEAQLIAIGDWGMDANSTTVAEMNLDSGRSSNKWRFHALPNNDPDSAPQAADREIQRRQEELFRRALRGPGSANPALKLLRFGQFLHYLEDKWSHWGYTTRWGHFWPNAAETIINALGFGWLHGHRWVTMSPDRPHVRSLHYNYMVVDTMFNLGSLARDMGKNAKCWPWSQTRIRGVQNPFYWSPVRIRERIRRGRDVNRAVGHYFIWADKLGLVATNKYRSRREGEDAVIENTVEHIGDQTSSMPRTIRRDRRFRKVRWNGSGDPTDAAGQPLRADQIPRDPSRALRTLQTAAAPAFNLRLASRRLSAFNEPGGGRIHWEFSVANVGDAPSEPASVRVLVADWSRSPFGYVQQETEFAYTGVLEIPGLPPGEEHSAVYDTRTEQAVEGRPIVGALQLVSNDLHSEDNVAYGTSVRQEAELPSAVPLFVVDEFSVGVAYSLGDAEAGEELLEDPTIEIQVTLQHVRGPQADLDVPLLSMMGETYEPAEAWEEMEGRIRLRYLTVPASQLLNPVARLNLAGRVPRGRREAEFQYTFHLHVAPPLALAPTYGDSVTERGDAQ